MFDLNRSKNATSLTLDLLRATAAQMVCVGHALSFFLSDWRPTYFALPQNVGVLLFFLISGFLITHTLIQRSKDPAYSFLQFCIERFARIYTGLIPALVVVIIVDGIAIYCTSDPVIMRYYTLKTLIANLFMLEGYRGILPQYLQWSAFGSASPLWTLGIEWHIYIFVGAVFFIVARPRSALFLVPVIIFFGQTPLHFLFGSFQPDGVGFALFTLWLFGALIYLSGLLRIPGLLSAALIQLIGVSAFIAVTRTGAEYNLRSYILLAAAFFGLIAVAHSMRAVTSPAFSKSISFAADYSFSLYLVHHTIMYGMWTIFQTRGMGMFITAVVVSNVTAITLAEIGEKRHRLFARHLARMLRRASNETAVANKPVANLRPPTVR